MLRHRIKTDLGSVGDVRTDFELPPSVRSIEEVEVLLLDGTAGNGPVGEALPQLLRVTAFGYASYPACKGAITCLFFS